MRTKKNKVGAFLGSKLHSGRVTSSSAGNGRTATDRQQRSSLGPAEAGQTRYMLCTATVRGTSARLRESANSLGRGCGRELGVMYVQAQLLGPYVAIPGSRQSDDVATRYASGQMRFPGAGWGICVSPTGGPQGQLQTCLVRDWKGDLSGSPRLVGAKQAASPRSRLLGAPPFDDDAREPSLSPLRLCL